MTSRSPLVRLLFGALVLAAALVGSGVRAEPLNVPAGGIPNETPQELKGVDIHENLGRALPPDARFKDSDGKDVTLGQLFDGKRPVVLVFAYHSCPMLCSLVLDATAKALKEVDWTVGKEFDVVSISFDPRDTPETAAKKKAQIVSLYGRGDAKGWHFLVGDDANIHKVTDAVGFTYRWDEAQQQYAHPAAIYLTTPDGRMARYLYGLGFDPADVRLALLDASQGKTLSVGEKFLIYCYQYDPKTHKYALAATNVMRLGGVLTIVVLGGLLTALWRRERRKKAAHDSSEQRGTTPASVEAK